MIASFGDPITLACQADGSPSPFYEWYKEGILIPGANLPSLRVPEALPDDRGNYSCKAVNSEGAIESGPTIVSLPGIIYTNYTCITRDLLYLL